MNKVAALLFIATFIGGCGGDSSTDALKSGETISVGERRVISIPISFQSTTCINFSDRNCMAPKKVAVQLPATISFVGSAEVKTSSGDFISGGKDIGAPQVVDCGAGVQALVFNIPSYSRDFNSGDDDDSIVVDLFDDLFNSVAESFTIKISGTAPKANLSVHAADDIALE